MSYRSERFNRSMSSLEEHLGDRDASKLAELGDGGESVRRMLAALDYTAEAEQADAAQARKRRLARFVVAVKRLNAAGKAHLVPTLMCILKNRDKPYLTLKHMSERTYYRHRAKLCAFFGVVE